MTYFTTYPHRFTRNSVDETIHYLLHGDFWPDSDDMEFADDIELPDPRTELWSVHDIRQLRPDLTRSQAWDVLKALIGSGSDGEPTSRYAAQQVACDLYGPPPLQ